MSAAPVSRFLEDFGKLPPAGSLGASGQGAFSAAGMAGGSLGAAMAEPDPAEQLEQAIKAAYDDGYRAAREELEADAMARIEAAAKEARQAAEAARAADIAALSAALETLFAGYDGFIDHLVETALRPLVAHALKTGALDQFKQKLVELVDRKNMVVNLAGPRRLAEDAAALLAPHGVEAQIAEDEQGELTARLGVDTLRTRLRRIDGFLGELGDHDMAERDD